MRSNKKKKEKQKNKKDKWTKILLKTLYAEKKHKMSLKIIKSNTLNQILYKENLKNYMANF